MIRKDWTGNNGMLDVWEQGNLACWLFLFISSKFSWPGCLAVRLMFLGRLKSFFFAEYDTWIWILSKRKQDGSKLRKN